MLITMVLRSAKDCCRDASTKLRSVSCLLKGFRAPDQDFPPTTRAPRSAREGLPARLQGGLVEGPGSGDGRQSRRGHGVRDDRRRGRLQGFRVQGWLRGGRGLAARAPLRAGVGLARGLAGLVRQGSVLHHRQRN